MADEDGSSSSISHESKTIEPIMAADDFARILESLNSTDPQTRKTAEEQYESIPQSAKCSSLLTSFLAAQNDEKRLSILGRLQSHLDLHWTIIFPNSWTNDRMNQMCSALLNVLQCDATNPSVRGQLAQLIAVITRHRMNDNSDAQNWDQLIEYIKMSAYSYYDHHVTSSLAIVQEVPNIFSTDGDACYVFFEGCMKEDHPRDFAILSATIRALVTAHSSAKCTVETREALNALVAHLASVINRGASYRGRVPASNEAERVFVELCADSGNMDTQKFALKVLKSSDHALDRQCLDDVRIMLTNCLSSTDASARSAVLEVYPIIMKHQLPLRHIFCAILSMCEFGANPSEDEEEEDDGADSHTPLDCHIEISQTDTSLDAAVIECLYEVSRCVPSLLIYNLRSVINVCCRIILDNQHNNTGYARMMLDLLCDNSAMIDSQQIPLLLEAALFLAFESDREEWEEEEGEWADNEWISPCNASNRSARRFLRNLIAGSGPEPNLINESGGDNLQSIAETIQGDADWTKRYVSALAWRLLGDVCTDEADVVKSTTGLVTLLADTSPFVQNIACEALKKLARRRAPNLQENSHSTVVPALISLLRQTTVPPRVAAHAGAALAMFIKHCPKNSTINLEPAFLEIIAHLQSTYVTLLAENRTVLLDKTLAPIRALAEIVPLLIYANYNDVMAPLRGILTEKPRGEFLSIVIRAMSGVGKAAGRSRFLDDGMAVICYTSAHIDALLSTNMSDGIDNIFKLCGPDSSRFLPSLVPALLAACKTVEFPRDVDDTMEYMLHTRSDTAQSMIRSLMSMGEIFDPYMKYVAVAAIEILRISNNNTRCDDFFWAANIMPIAFAAIKKKEPTAIRSLWLSYWSAIKPVMISRQLIRSILMVIRAIGPKELADEEMAVVVELAKRELEQKKRYLEEMIADLEDEEEKDQSIGRICECIHYGLISIGDQFIPLVHQVMPFLAPLIEGTVWDKYINETILHVAAEPSKTVNQ